MTQRINEVSVEAEQTGRRGTQVRDDIANLDSMVRGLKQSVSRVVHTSSTDADRRAAPRSAVELHCHVAVPGQSPIAARVGDISDGGACILGGPVLPMGASGWLTVDGFELPLPFTVQSNVDDALHVAFTPDAATVSTLRSQLQRLTRQRQAA
jgi:PilZ domain